MAKHEHSVELAGVNLAGRNHVCAFFNTIDEEHRVLGSFYKDGIDRGEKAAHIVDPENREEHLKRLAEAGIDVQKMMDTAQFWEVFCCVVRSYQRRWCVRAQAAETSPRT